MRQTLLLILAIFSSACSNMIFQPDRQDYLDPKKAEQALGITLEDVYFKSSDGTQLHGWFLPNKAKKKKGTIMFLHGNAQNISTHVRFVWWLPLNGYDVFIFDYRGYGRSAGEAELDGVHRDVQSAMATLLARKDIHPKNLVLYGHSLGGALAITSLADSAYRNRFKLLIVEDTFTSYRTVAREALGNFWLTWAFQYPLSWTIRDDYRPIDAIPRISPIPLLLIHGDSDPIIDRHHGAELFAAAKEPKEFWLIAGGGHNSMENEQQRLRLLKYLDKILK